MKFLYSLLLAAFAAALGAAGFLIFRGGKPLPVRAEVPSFSLVERSGRPLSLADLRGKVWVADFIFTRCQGPCPLMTGRMATLADDLAGIEDVRFVSISADPAHDMPAVLAKYAESYEVKDPRWLFATGKEDEIVKTSRGMLLAIETPDAEKPNAIVHSEKMVLVDRHGRIRGYYDPMNAEEYERLRRDVRRLLRERADA
jgi:cytochrome oxidase Cu insertion factor (SCO1/SenC/PrrC family)